MSYTCRFLQFGTKQTRVPGYETDLVLDDAMYPAPTYQNLYDKTATLWGLQFSSCSGTFYLATAAVPGHQGDIINSWYATGGGNGHYLVVTPFIIRADGTEGFDPVGTFVDFDVPSASVNSVDTDQIPKASVTATVHAELPEYEHLDISTHATSHSVIITTTTTQVIFDQIFVYAGKIQPQGNKLVVPKGVGCFALAVFKERKSVTSKEISTIQWPRIPKWEWPMIVNEIVLEAITKGRGEILEHLSPKLITEMEPELLRKALGSIGKRVDDLERIKSVIAGLIERK